MMTKIEMKKTHIKKNRNEKKLESDGNRSESSNLIASGNR